MAELHIWLVKEKLDKFDDAEDNHVEQEKWAWSPLYCILKEWPLANFCKSPWVHIQEKWEKIEKKLLENLKTKPLFLEAV